MEARLNAIRLKTILVDRTGREAHIERATGIRVGSDFVYQVPGAKRGDVRTMLAVFGARILAINVISSAHMGKRPALDELRKRFDAIETDSWYSAAGNTTPAA